MNQSEILQKAIENGIIDLCTIQIELDMNERKKFLEKHENNIWQGSDNKWYTYLPDMTKSNNRRKIKKNTKEQLDDYIIDFSPGKVRFHNNLSRYYDHAWQVHCCY